MHAVSRMGFLENRKVENPLATKKESTALAEYLERAKRCGIKGEYVFETAFARYRSLVERLDSLQKIIIDAGCTVEKSYVKGEKNLYINPAVAAYNQTASVADKTLQTLLKILETAEQKAEAASGDEFDEF